VAMNEITQRITEKDNEIPKNMFYTDNIINWKPKEKILEAKFHRIVTLCEEFRLNVNGYVYGYENMLENRRHAEDKM
jgi:regulator of RNase E activity RraB